MMEYDILLTFTYKGMTKEINRKIKEGWIPQGGVFQASNGNVIQAILRHSEVSDLSPG